MKKVTTLVMLVLVCLALANTSFANYSFTANLEEPSANELSAPFITVEELKLKMSKQESVVVLDVRGKDYDTSPTRIKGATRIVPSELVNNLTKLPKDKVIVTYCACPTDGGSISAAKTLMQNGFKQVYVLKGGWNSWNGVNGQVENK